MMRKIIIAALLWAVTFASCNSIATHLGKKTPRETYEEKLENSGLEKTPEGRQWLLASAAALQHPQEVQLPLQLAGSFRNNQPRALGLQFTAMHGERITFMIEKNTAASFTLYAELFGHKADGGTALLYAADTVTTTFSYTIAETGTYTLKLQPELYQAGTYRLSVSVGPSLGFPVAGLKASIGSRWGDDRDGGKRAHEGIDIFAPKGTPAVAAAEGYVTGVREGGLGGKTVWLRPLHQNVTLYYAHLDAQLVHEGQPVEQGDTIGLVGNTGNARYTPSHLHFGIYGDGGATDPLPFVNRTEKTAPPLPKQTLPGLMQLRKDFKTGDSVVKKNSLLVPLARTSAAYIAELPDGRVIQMPTALLTSVPSTLQPLKNHSRLGQ